MQASAAPGAYIARMRRTERLEIPSVAAWMVALLLAAAPLVASAQAEGDWMTKHNEARIHIAACGQRLCGVLAWMAAPIDSVTGKPLVDDRNPNPALRGRPLLGLRILSGFKADGPGQWTDGRIYDPNLGHAFVSKLRLEPDGRLKVDGCIAFLCGGQKWTRAP